MEFSDKVLRCRDCNQEFVFSAGEQTFFKEMRFEHEPRRCKGCKAERDHVRCRMETLVRCAECGAPTTVPFLPRHGRPVLCRSCFQQQQQLSVAEA